jgi:hypothetical protein
MNAFARLWACFPYLVWAQVLERKGEETVATGDIWARLPKFLLEGKLIAWSLTMHAAPFVLLVWVGYTFVGG